MNYTIKDYYKTIQIFEKWFYPRSSKSTLVGHVFLLSVGIWCEILTTEWLSLNTDFINFSSCDILYYLLATAHVHDHLYALKEKN